MIRLSYWAIFFLMIILGGLPIEHSIKIELSIAGGLLLGFLSAINFPLMNPIELNKVNSNSIEARKIIKASLSKLYQPFLARPLVESELARPINVDLKDSIKTLISILMCFSLTMMLWYEPTLLEFNFESHTSFPEMLKPIGLQILYVLLISTGFAGVFLNLIDKFFTVKQK